MNTAALGLMGAPLAFVALPLYVLLPHHYAQQYGLPLAVLGSLLLATRLVDALADPVIGWLLDRRAPSAVLRRSAWLSSAVLAAGFAALFFPPRALWQDQPGLLLWCGVALLVTYVAFSWTTLAHQAYSTHLGGSLAQRSRIVAWREGWGLAGVVAASLLPALLGLPATCGALVACLLAGLVAWSWAAASEAGRADAGAGAVTMAAVTAPPMAATTGATPEPRRASKLWSPLADPAFRRLLVVFVVNGMASAVPATLVLFFIRDRLLLPAWEPAFLAAYFLSAALALPLWVRLAARCGAARAWALGMLMAVLAFAGVTGLQAGDAGRFMAVCVASGAALGADLAMPGALLTGVIRRGAASAAPAQVAAPQDGSYLGWWNVATKLNLALAAGTALPLLQTLGYAPGTHSATGLQALVWTYAALPCALKLLAVGLLHTLWIRRVAPDQE